MSKKSTRDAGIERMAEVMREFMARAVLFQDAVARVGGINSTDMQAVSLLMSEGPATPGELAQRTGLTAGGAITAVVDRLERAGYVTRERDAGDRRRVIVTAQADTVLDRVGPIYGRVGQRWADYLATLTDEQIEFANELFARAAEINREEIEVLRGG
ncbi:MarR family winged helix-turn-helix transcriptional regulator [Microbacterium sp.]|uniref:MarR family winged helix-turn-helix transcriptional regulator n=1 Tax=Microbacterium sp. TaxID=51671 RepID=UPI002E31164E|nr:MarR family transcriptional regulator [Microbacterium sp.]HEX5731131.1 MarR family transcriptional regulator [Microbacterium sp.]